MSQFEELAQQTEDIFSGELQKCRHPPLAGVTPPGFCIVCWGVGWYYPDSLQGILHREVSEARVSYCFCLAVEGHAFQSCKDCRECEGCRLTIRLHGTRVPLTSVTAVALHEGVWPSPAQLRLIAQTFVYRSKTK